MAARLFRRQLASLPRRIDQKDDLIVAIQPKLSVATPEQAKARQMRGTIRRLS